jgi:hypothetical protein
MMRSDLIGGSKTLEPGAAPNSWNRIKINVRTWRLIISEPDALRAAAHRNHRNDQLDPNKRSYSAIMITKKLRWFL